MQDTELFLSLAEIAGVFVGFGALIALRGGAGARPSEVMFVGLVVLLGVQTIAAALTPVAISRFNVAGHGLWVACSLIALAVFWIGQEVQARASPERRALLAAVTFRERGRWEVVGALFWLPMTIALAVVVLGIAPAYEEALYVAAVVLMLLMDAVMVLAAATVGTPSWDLRTGPGGDDPAG